MKRFLLFAAIATLGFGQNIMIFPQLTIGGETQLRVSVEIQNSDNFVGFQFDLPLDDELVYLSGSAMLTDRSNGHAISASIVNGNTLRLFAYSMSQTPFTGNSGAVCSFYLATGTVPGNYPLTPADPIIGNANSQNILTAVTNGQVTIQSPDIDIPTQGMNYDRVPLTSYSDRSFTIYNQGNSTLNVTSIATSHIDFELLGASTSSIPSGSSESVTVRFHSNTKGTYVETVTILSDDPDEPSLTVTLEVIAYAVNELDINDMFGRSGHNSTMTIDISNMEEFVGFSFDLQLPGVMTYIPSSIQLTSRASDHVVDATTLGNGNVRVVAYSPSNTVFSGIEGDVVELDFALDGLGGFYSPQFINPVIGDNNSENIISDNYSGTLEIAAPDLSVNQTSFDFGQVSIFDTSTVNLIISNTGSDTLHISSLIYNEASFFTDVEAPIQILPSANQTVPIQYHNSAEGVHSTTLRIRNNDPDEDPQDIALTANSFIPNIMRIEDATLYTLSSGWVGISIENNEPFVGFQFDLAYPAGIEYSGTSELSSRANGHQFSITDLGNGTLRTIVYALDQSEFTGTSGEVIRFQFNAIDTTAGFALQLTVPIIGNAASEDILSSSENGSVQIEYGGPTVSSLEPLNIAEDADSTITFESIYPNISDPNTSSADLALSLSGSEHVNVEISGSTWILSPAANWHGSENLEIIVSDDHYADTTSWTVTVSPVNDAPVLADISGQELLEDSDLTRVLSAEDIDGDDLTFSAESADAQVTVTVSNDRLYMIPAADWNGSSAITVTVDDGSGSANATDIGSFTLTVTPVNDAPVLADISAQSTPEETAIDVVLSAADIDGDDLTYSAVSDTSVVLVSVIGSTLTLTPQVNWNGSAQITVIVDDSTETTNSADTTSFTLTVMPVNDPPQIHTAVQDTSIFEDMSLMIPFWISDDDEMDSLIVRVSGDIEHISGSYADSILTIIPNENWNGSALLVLEVSDNDTTVSDTFNLVVLPANDPPEAFDLIYPGNELVLDDADSIDVSFTWESALDVDGDSLSYGLSIFSDSEFDSLFIVAGPQLRMNIENFPRDVWLNWDVWVTDGQDTIWSTSTFSLKIDQTVGIIAQALTPDEFVLNQNYPNPFNPTTTIRYGLPDVADVSVIIYDLRGREICSWDFNSQTAGWYDLAWQGDTQGGDQVGTGLYFCRIVAGNYCRTIKMIYMK